MAWSQTRRGGSLSKELLALPYSTQAHSYMHVEVSDPVPFHLANREPSSPYPPQFGFCLIALARWCIIPRCVHLSSPCALHPALYAFPFCLVFVASAHAYSAVCFLLRVCICVPCCTCRASSFYFHSLLPMP